MYCLLPFVAETGFMTSPGAMLDEIFRKPGQRMFVHSFSEPALCYCIAKISEDITQIQHHLAHSISIYTFLFNINKQHMHCYVVDLELTSPTMYLYKI